MGTYGGYSSRNELVHEVTATYENDQQIQIAEKKFFSGNDLWVLFRRTSKMAPTDIERFIVLFKISRWGAGDWAYKPIEESMGPFEYTCPLSFIEAAQHPFPNGYPEGYGDWRTKVRAFHARKNQKIGVGDIVKLTNGKEYRVIEVGRKLRGSDMLTGSTYILPRRMLTENAITMNKVVGGAA